jgi:hypothetical protein
MPSAPFSPPSPHARDNNAHENVVLPSHNVSEEKLAGRPKGGLFSRQRALGPVGKDGGDWALLACCLVTGLVDAASFSNYSVFVGMQTGE